MDVYQYFPRELRDVPLFDQVLFALQKIADDAEAETRDSVGKYSDIPSLPRDLLLLIIEEAGYDYIAEVLSLDEARLRELTVLMSLIHFLKGHRDGLLLVIDLLGFAGSSVEEWWEVDPERTPATFKMILNLNASNLGQDAVPRLLNFVRNYVYPLLTELEFVADAVESDLVSGGKTADQSFSTTISASL